MADRHSLCVAQRVSHHPLFTLPLLIGDVHSATAEDRGLWIVLGDELSGFGLVQHQRALSAAEQIVSHRQHDPIRLEVAGLRQFTGLESAL